MFYSRELILLLYILADYIFRIIQKFRIWIFQITKVEIKDIFKLWLFETFLKSRNKKCCLVLLKRIDQLVHHHPFTTSCCLDKQAIMKIRSIGMRDRRKLNLVHFFGFLVAYQNIEVELQNYFKHTTILRDYQILGHLISY